MTTIDSTSDDVRVAEIAAGLSANERRELLAQCRRSYSLPVIKWSMAGSSLVWQRLLMLSPDTRSNGVRLTPLGLAVRAHLLTTRTNKDG